MKQSAALTLLVLNLLLCAAWGQTETLVYSFAGAPTDGAEPWTNLVFDTHSNLYGTTEYGGAYSSGTVFRVTLSGNETVLYSFTGQPDGMWPMSGLVLDAAGNLYGTTPEGGASNYGGGAGTVFRVSPSGVETVLYSFCILTNCVDGSIPLAGLVLDKKGNLYGTTNTGGNYDSSTVFKVSPSGKETVLYSFCTKRACEDGGGPYSALLFDKKGNLYGTTSGGGAYGAGTVFKLSPSGKETVLHSFSGGTDGNK